jgi:hypothetical protein
MRRLSTWVIWWYHSAMLKDYSELERKAWIQTKARGKNRFVWGQVLQNVLIVAAVIGGIEFLNRTHQVFSLTTLLIDIGVLSISVLGGFLTGNWKWKDFEKKYPHL